VRVAFDGFSMTSGPLNYADKQGIFKKFGLDITPVFLEGGSTVTTAVVGGFGRYRAEWLHAGCIRCGRRANVVIIGGIANKLPFQLVGAQIDHHRRAAQGPGDRNQPLWFFDDTAGDFALEHLKLSRNDVKVLQLGGPRPVSRP